MSVPQALQTETTSSAPVSHPSPIHSWLAERDWNELSKYLLDRLQFLEVQRFTHLDARGQQFINHSVFELLQAFAHPEFVIPAEHSREFIELNPAVANLVAITPFQTTDAILEMIIQTGIHCDNIAKVCTLYSARNRLRLDRNLLFEEDAQLASAWYMAYHENYYTVPADRRALENYREHLRYQHPRQEFAIERANSAYYGCSYADPARDRFVKGRINRAFQLLNAPIRIRHRPATGDRPKIAVIGDIWWPGHSVYRNQFYFLASLKDRYHLTFIHAVIPDTGKFDLSLFDDVWWVGDGQGGINFDAFDNNEFVLAYFPDIGMTDASIRLANLRIAPVQACGVGHSVSTFGSEIDYYISGADVEPEGAQDNYSETLVLLPGYGIVNNSIEYRSQLAADDFDRDVVNCPWSAHKTNCETLQLLEKVRRSLSGKVCFRFFTGQPSLRHCGHPIFVRSIASELDVSAVDVRPNLGYGKYMQAMESGSICADAFPYGGCNGVADALYLGKPIVVYEGTSWYNRIGPAMLRSIGLEELIARDDREYVDKLVKLLSDDSYRDELAARIRQAMRSNTIFDRSQASEFRKAIDYVIQHRPSEGFGGRRQPITSADYGGSGA